jgi:hypothetical protein
MTKGESMSDENRVGPTGGMVQEIRTASFEKVRAYRSLDVLTYAAGGVLVFNTLACLAQFAAFIHQWQLLQMVGARAFSSQEAMVGAATASDAMVRVTSIAAFSSLILCYIVSGFWIYQAAANVRALGARRLQDSPGWAVGWYFVPIMSWFRPFVAMAEIWRASYAPLQWLSKPTPALVKLWWAGFLATNVFGYLTLVFTRSDGSIPGLILSTQLHIVDTALDVVGNVLFLLLIFGIRRGQAGSREGMKRVEEVFA